MTAIVFAAFDDVALAARGDPGPVLALIRAGR
jgi:hypothetical protein